MQELLYWLLWVSFWSALLVGASLGGKYAIDHWTAWRHVLSPVWLLRAVGELLHRLGRASIDAGESLESGWLAIVAEWNARREADRTGFLVGWDVGRGDDRTVVYLLEHERPAVIEAAKAFFESGDLRARRKAEQR